MGSDNLRLPGPGVQGLISQKNLYAHCNLHLLNLVIVKACSLPTWLQP